MCVRACVRVCVCVCVCARARARAYEVHVQVSTYLVAVDCDLLERLHVVDSEYEQESLSGAHVLISHGTAK